MDKLKLNDKDYPFWFALKAQREMSKNKDLIEKDDTYFIWLGLKYGAMKENIKFVLSEEGLIDILEDDLDAYEKACELLGEQMGKLKKMKTKALEVLQ